MIDINPANKGKFTATKKKTGESTEELEHSKNPLTRKRAVFAENAKHWHHKGRKSRAAALSAKLDQIITFAEKKKDNEPLSEAGLNIRRSMTGLGGAIGAYAGVLRGAETGSLSSAIEGGAQGLEKFQHYRHQDIARTKLKNAQRYHEIEDMHGGKVYALKDRPKTPFKESMANMGSKIKGYGRAAKQLPIRGRYMAEDALHGAKNWLTRSSLSRSVTAGALIGTAAGRYIGTKSARSHDRALKDRRIALRKERESS